MSVPRSCPCCGARDAVVTLAPSPPVEGLVEGDVAPVSFCRACGRMLAPRREC